jgi:hypothetical protein
MTTLNKIHRQAVLLRFIIVSCLFLFLSVPEILAQNQKEDQFPFDQTEKSSTPAAADRLFFGGSFGLSLGTITDISVSPVVGFWLLPRLAIAAGPSYRYYKDPIDRTALYGGRGYLEFVVVQNLNSVVPMGVHTGLFLHLEDELLSLKTSFWKNPPPYLTDRFYVNTVLAGAGISQQLGKRSSLNFMALWPLNESKYAIYSKPVLRLSFIF